MTDSLLPTLPNREEKWYPDIGKPILSVIRVKPTRQMGQMSNRKWQQAAWASHVSENDRFTAILEGIS
jgi:hypothetical protein